MTAPAVVKTCTRCGKIKPLGLYRRHPTGKLGRQSWCNECQREYMAERRANDRQVQARDTKQARAYRAAEVRVQENHRDEFDAYYADELAKRGIVREAS